MKFSQKAQRIFWWFIGSIAACIAAVLLMALLPMPLKFSAPPDKPSGDYAAARAAMEAWFAATPGNLSAAGQPRAFLHNAPTETVFVLLHGLCNGPEQFDKLGRMLFERGHNVVIPLTPGHGEADVMTDALKDFSAVEMVETASHAVSLARGLGTRVTVVGLSINGTTAAWMSQNRQDVHRAILLAPFLSLYGLPDRATLPLSRAVRRIPNFFIWWNPAQKQNLEGPAYVYPRFSTRSIAATMALGADVRQSAKSHPPQASSILVVTSAADYAANNAATARLVAEWRTLRSSGIATYEFPKSENVPHDFIDPGQPNQAVDLVYPRLLDMLESGLPPEK